MQSKEIYTKTVEYALKLICRKRYTETQITEKIANFLGRRFKEDFPPQKDEQEKKALVEKVVKRLKELEYINDLKFVEHYVSDRLRFRPRGEFMLRQELFKKGIKKDYLDSFFEKETINEFEVAMNCYEKRKKKWEKFELREKKQKVFQYLAGRGFQLDVIYKVLERC